MGKLGSFELTAGSDVDLILLYDYDEDGGEIRRRTSRSMPPRYFTRMTQRLIAALSAPTAEGRALRGGPAACARPATRARSPPTSIPSANTSARRPGPGSTWR